MGYYWFMEQLIFALSMMLKPLGLLALIVFLALHRVIISRFMADCRLKRLLLTRLDTKGGDTQVGSGRGNLWAELTHDFRSLGK